MISPLSPSSPSCRHFLPSSCRRRLFFMSMSFLFQKQQDAQSISCSSSPFSWPNKVGEKTQTGRPPGISKRNALSLPSTRRSFVKNAQCHDSIGSRVFLSLSLTYRNPTPVFSTRHNARQAILDRWASTPCAQRKRPTSRLWRARYPCKKKRLPPCCRPIPKSLFLWGEIKEMANVFVFDFLWD